MHSAIFAVACFARYGDYITQVRYPA